MKTEDSIEGTFGAAAFQTLMVCGFEDTLSGSRSPKKRNSSLVVSFRMKNAADSYTSAENLVVPCVTGNEHTEISGLISMYLLSAGNLI